MKTTPLTPEQIENWRKALSTQLGPYAFVMPVEEVQAMHDIVQKRLDALIPSDPILSS
jgi:hypothetical protein